LPPVAQRTRPPHRSAEAWRRADAASTNWKRPRPRNLLCDGTRAV